MTEQLTMWIEAVMTMPFFYPLVGLTVAFDALGPAFPSETVLNLAGAWAGARGEPDITQVILWAIGGAIIGDNVCYFLGTKMMRYVDRFPADSKAGNALTWVRRNMRKRAGSTIIAARFVPWGRWIATIVLGSVRYPWPAFFFFDTIGVVVWALINTMVAYVGGMVLQNVPLLGLIVGMGLGLFVGFLIQKAQNRFFEWRDERRGFAEA